MTNTLLPLKEQTSRGPLIKKQIHLTATREARARG